MPNVILEIGTEEQPSSFVVASENFFLDFFKKNLNSINYKNIISYSTTRRIALCFEEIADKEDDVNMSVKGPKKEISFDKDGTPTKALVGFASKYSLKPDEVNFNETEKGLVAQVNFAQKGRPIEALLDEITNNCLYKIRFRKSMRWIPNSNFSFSRPIRYVYCSIDGNPVKLPSIDENIPFRTSLPGHPFLSQNEITLTKSKADEYVKAMKKEFVLVDRDERKKIIKEQIAEIIKKNKGVSDYPNLLIEVTDLVEFPNAVECSFEERFLNLPACVLESSMIDHQRYFPIKNKDNKLINKFICITNRAQKSLDKIREGNERVLKARLTDAEFFWNLDVKEKLEDRIEGLNEVLFLGNLGNFFDKTKRLNSICKFIAGQINLGNDELKNLEVASNLAKADLLTEMVGEFTNLQGEMGYEYAKFEGYDEIIAKAIKEHYMPRFAGDALPSNKISAILAIADKVDNVSAVFSLNLKPSGSADPYSIRRQGIGIIKIISEFHFNLDLSELFKFALEQLPNKNELSPNLLDDLMNFINDRLVQIALDEGYDHKEIKATVSAGINNIPLFFKRIAEVKALRKNPAWNDLYSLVERTFNIGKNFDKKGEINRKLFDSKEENDLYQAYIDNKKEIIELYEKQKYLDASLKYLEIFGTAVNNFFECVYVNVEDKEIRANRLILLTEINQLFINNFANIAFIS